jgi:hypothetical protein
MSGENTVRAEMHCLIFRNGTSRSSVHAGEDPRVLQRSTDHGIVPSLGAAQFTSAENGALQPTDGARERISIFGAAMVRRASEERLIA